MNLLFERLKDYHLLTCQLLNFDLLLVNLKKQEEKVVKELRDCGRLQDSLRQALI